jgi:hypothetical protein
MRLGFDVAWSNRLMRQQIQPLVFQYPCGCARLLATGEYIAFCPHDAAAVQLELFEEER